MKLVDILRQIILVWPEDNVFTIDPSGLLQAWPNNGCHTTMKMSGSVRDTHDELVIEFNDDQLSWMPLNTYKNTMVPVLFRSPIPIHAEDWKTSVVTERQWREANRE